MDLKILEIASNTKNNKIVKNFTHLAKDKNPICGDEMEITLRIADDKIIDFGYQSKSCIYCQASASLLSVNIKNKKTKFVNQLIQDLEIFFSGSSNKFKKKWPQYKVLLKEKNLARKGCILLPFKTLKKALKS
tara:strand:- start:115 stop:513 length:399 start_codon:yes stop_codon:yes gene_type:complete